MIWLLMTRESFLEITTDNYLSAVGDSLTFDLQGKSSVYLLRENLNIYSYKLTDGVNFLQTTPIGAREIHELAKNGSNLVQDGGNN